MKTRTLSLAAAVAIDLALSEPPADYHPVVLAGRALALGTDRFRTQGRRAQMLGGAAALLGTVAAAALTAAANTADSMYGYHGENEWLGKVAAKSDDLLSWLPSRLAATAIVAAAGFRLGPGAAASALSTWRTDGGLTQSPNAGRPMAAMAGALGRRLEKREHYVLGGEYPEPSADDVRGAVDLTATASGIALASIAAAMLITTSR